VRFRDVKPIWEVLLQLAFWATPIIYAIETIGVSERIQEALMLNPLAVIVQQFRHAVIDPSAPSAAAAAGGAEMLLIPGAILFGFAALGYWYFDREAPRMAEDL
jgi:ABC-2 type transport system permease protein